MVSSLPDAKATMFFSKETFSSFVASHLFKSLRTIKFILLISLKVHILVQNIVNCYQECCLGIFDL